MAPGMPPPRARQPRPLGHTHGSSYAMAPHPYGVQPSGNALLLTMMATGTDSSHSHSSSPGGTAVPRRLSRDPGLGNLRRLPDELVCEVFSCLEVPGLGRSAAVSQAFYAFAHADELWRGLALERFGGDFVFARSWKDTYQLRLVGPDRFAPHEPIRVRHFCSDHLFQPWLYGGVDVPPAWLQGDATVGYRRDADELTVEMFVEQYERPNRPVLIQGAVKDWPALKRWTRDHLLERYGDVKFRAGPVDIRLRDYLTYGEQVREERPLYIFDSHFAVKAPSMAEDYQVPKYFQEDLFSVLGPDRPDNRWLVLGPSRSGSSFHIDPNQTNAWNAVIQGAKKWILFPPDHIPPGVCPSADMGEVATTVSISEWFMHYFADLRKLSSSSSSSSPVVVQFLARPGDLVFVPHGWWHLVLNVGETIAITQNYVGSCNLESVLRFLEHKRDQVSGVRRGLAPVLYERFVAGLQRDHPDLARRHAERKRQREEEERAAEEQRQAKRAIKQQHQFGWASALLPPTTEGGEEFLL